MITPINFAKDFMTTSTSPQPRAVPDELLPQARTIILRNQNPSVALLQRHLKIGYNRALGLLQQLEGDVVTAPDENGWRLMIETGARSPNDPQFVGTAAATPVKATCVEAAIGMHSLSPEERARRQRNSQPMELNHYLQQHREPCPEWLQNFKKGAKFNRQQFFGSRVVYYPGSGSDGHAVKLFGSTHSAHCFIYVDYLVKQSRIKAELKGAHDGYDGACQGYHPLARLQLSETDLIPTGWVQHVHGLERTRFSDDFKPYAFLEILERDDNYGDDHGAHRLAILFLGADGIASYDALFCQKNGVPPPFAVLIQEHGFGGNYDKFGQGGLLERIAATCNVYPQLQLVAEDSAAWHDFKPIANLKGSVGGMHGNNRFLHARTVSNRPA